MLFWAFFEIGFYFVAQANLKPIILLDESVLRVTAPGLEDMYLSFKDLNMYVCWEPNLGSLQELVAFNC